MSKRAIALKFMADMRFGCKDADWSADADKEASRLYYKLMKHDIDPDMARDYVAAVAAREGAAPDMERLSVVQERFDVDALSRVDLRGWLSFDQFRRVTSREWHGPCPKCGGRDRFALREGAGRQFVGCRQCTGLEKGQWMDGIAFIRWLADCDFRRACETLRLGRKPALKSAPRRDRRPSVAAGRPSAWRHAGELVDGCANNLSADDIAYLQGRGISESTARRHKIGASRGGTYKGLFIPAGLVIPCLIDGAPSYIKVRTAEGYRQVKGGSPALYAPTESHRLAVLVETELDALMLACRVEELGLPIAIYATGSTSWNRGCRGELIGRHALYTAFDHDEAGREAARYWRVPALHYEGGDVGDLYDGSWVAVDALIAQVAPLPVAPEPPPRLSTKAAMEAAMTDKPAEPAESADRGHEPEVIMVGEGEFESVMGYLFPTTAGQADAGADIQRMDWQPDERNVIWEGKLGDAPDWLFPERAAPAEPAARRDPFGGRVCKVSPTLNEMRATIQREGRLVIDGWDMTSVLL